MRRPFALALLAVLVLTLLPSAVALAGKPYYSHSKLTGSLSYTVVSDLDGDGHADWGETIRWIPVSTKTVSPHVEVRCSQAGTLVYSAAAGYYAGYLWPDAQNMTLDSMAWPDHTSATCRATLYYFAGRKTYRDAIYDFTVGA